MSIPLTKTKKIYSIVGSQLVFPKIEGGRLVRATAPIDRLDLVPRWTVEHGPKKSCCLSVSEKNGYHRYLHAAAGDAVEVKTDKAKALSLTPQLGGFRLGQDGKFLAIKDGKVAFVSPANEGRRVLANRNTDQLFTFEDDLAAPLVGSFYRQRDGDFFYLTIDKGGVRFVLNPKTKPVLMLCGDHFSDKRRVGYTLCTLDEAWCLALPSAAGPATSTAGTKGYSGAALVQPVVESGRIAFRAVNTAQPWILHLPDVSATKSVAAKFGEMDEEPEWPVAASFVFEPSPLFTELHFWLLNRKTGNALTPGDSGNPGRVSCKPWRPGDHGQLWKFSGDNIAAADGRILTAPANPSSVAALTLTNEENGLLAYGGGILLHCEQFGTHVVVEEPRGHEPVLALKDAQSNAGTWDLVPFENFPRCAGDRFTAFQDRKSFMVLAAGSDLAWTRQTDGTVRLEPAGRNATPAQIWVNVDSYLHDPELRLVAVARPDGVLRCEATEGGAVPRKFRGQEWGMASDGRIVLRSAGNRYVENTPDGLSLASYRLGSEAKQCWSLVPVAECQPVRSLVPIAQIKVQTDDEVYPHPKFGLAKEAAKRYGGSIAYLGGANPSICFIYTSRTNKGARGSLSTKLSGDFICSWSTIAACRARPLVGVFEELIFQIAVHEEDGAVEYSFSKNPNLPGAAKQLLGKDYAPMHRSDNHPRPIFCEKGTQPALLYNAPGGNVWLFLQSRYLMRHRIFELQKRSATFRELDTNDTFRRQINDSIFSTSTTDLPGQELYGIMRAPALATLGDHVYCMSMAGNVIVWHRIHLKTGFWSKSAYVGLPKGISADLGPPGVTADGGHIKLTFADISGTIWLAKWEPGSKQLFRACKITGIEKSTRSQHPGFVTAGSTTYLTYSDHRRTQRVLSLDW